MPEDRVRRRLAAILAADVVGYSRLMGADEVGTLTRLKSLRSDLIDPEISGHQGRIVKEMGDGLLVEFASVVDAVQCAADIQVALARHASGDSKYEPITLRIGVNLGDLIVEGDDIFGDGVNVAARIEGLAEAGGVCISGAAYEQIKGKTDLEFEDAGHKPVKNIAEPVRVFRMSPLRASAEISPDDMLARPAVAVLPFDNISGDPEQEYFADGLTEDIITALSYWRSFPVIARNSTFAYKGKSQDVRTVATSLGARYVLEGSVRRGGQRIRITAQLIDATTGHHVWAEKFDRTLEDVFELQDEITRDIAAIVAPQLERAERRRVTTHAPRPNAWDLYQRGMSIFYQGTREAHAESRKYFQRAVDVDPTYSLAFASLARSYHDEAAIWQDSNMDAYLDKSLLAARRAVELDDSDSYAQAILGNTYMRLAKHDLAVAHCRKAIACNPNNAIAYIVLGSTLAYAGQPDEGIASIKNGLKLNPQDPHAHHFLLMLARAQLTAKHHAEALESGRGAIGLDANVLFAYVVVASALGHLGRVEEARSFLEECERMEPGRIAKEIKAAESIHSYAADTQHILQGLRKADWNG